ncbi:Uncharacterised protein [Flavonifractor plautii]|uniref:Uncharacterized protein n=1 Tax=Flavonifractor plautii TaxID=292800 RepID=A0A174PJZ6_FLAPL|nr:Uncharacterised protein [Flavonifractor plautii]
MCSFASWAMAGMCSVMLVEPPTLSPTRTASSSISWVTMSRGRMSSSTRRTTAMPLSLATRFFLPLTAWAQALPGIVRPMASAMMDMVLAVPIIAQEPGVGDISPSIYSYSSLEISPRVSFPAISFSS